MSKLSCILGAHPEEYIHETRQGRNFNISHFRSFKMCDNGRDNNMLNISQCVPQATDDHSVSIPISHGPVPWVQQMLNPLVTWVLCNKCVTIVL